MNFAGDHWSTLVYVAGVEYGGMEGAVWLAEKHALLGVGYVAIQKLPKEQWPPNAMIMQWVGVAQR